MSTYVDIYYPPGGGNVDVDTVSSLMSIVQNSFLAYDNPLLMKYIIAENIFDIPDIWVWSNMDGSYPILD